MLIQEVNLDTLKPNIDGYPLKNLSFNDISIYAERALQDQYNTFLFDFIQEEARYFNQYISIVKEEDVIDGEGEIVDNKVDEKGKQNLIQIIAKWFKEIFEKIKGFFTRLINKVKEIYGDRVKEHDQKVAKKFQESINSALNHSQEFGVIYGYSPEYFKAIVQNSPNGCKIMENIINKVNQYNGDDPEELREMFTKDKIAEELFGPGKTYDTMEKKDLVLSYYYKFKKKDIQKQQQSNMGWDFLREYSDKLTISDIKRDQNSIINIAFNNNNWMGALKENYNKVKEFIEDAKKGAEQNLKKYDKKSKPALLIKEYINICSSCTTIILRLAGVNNQTLQGIRINYLYIINETIKRAKQWT